VPAALGTQTNGSVIRPAAFCGIVGFKPTHDVIPLAGVHLFSQTLDTVGTFTRRVADAAWVAAVIADTGRIAPAIYPRERPPRLAVIPGYPWTTIAVEADALLDATATRLRLAGAEVVPAVLPEALDSGAKVLRTIMLYEAARNLRPLLERSRPQLSSLLADALDEGARISAADYAGALAARKAMIAVALEWMAHYDAILSPPTTGPAPEGLGSTGDPGCCSLWSLLGFPAISIPIGRAANGLPLGLQIAAPMHGDDGLLAVAAWCEQKLPFRGLV
jgi:amidase